MNIILASHGNYAQETKKSVEMIIGEQENLKAITFEMDMSVESLMRKYRETIKELPDGKILFLVDIIGGTPANAAMLLQEEEPQLLVYSGLSMTLLISLILNNDIVTAIQDTKDSMKKLSL